MIWRDKDGALTFRYEVIRSARRQFVMRLYIGIIEIPVKLELIVANLVVK
jgi:hypothetical protein